MPEKPRIAHWLKYHQVLFEAQTDVRLMGLRKTITVRLTLGRLWYWADRRMERYYQERDLSRGPNAHPRR